MTRGIDHVAEADPRLPTIPSRRKESTPSIDHEAVEIPVAEAIESTPTGGTGRVESTSKEPRFSPGETVADRYFVESCLGRGGMATVYRVRDLELDEPVALKLLDERLAADNRTVAMFKREIKLARKVVHRNVCRIFDFGSAGSAKFVTMEMIEGQTLAQLIERRVDLGFEGKLELIRDVVVGLRAIHLAGIVHRDIKPSNVMLAEPGRSVVMDFGIAKDRESDDLSATGVALGTPHYMSPEQFRAEEADLRSDLYSLGIVLYEVMAGERPFDGSNVALLANQHLHEKPRHPVHLRPDLPAELSDIILRLLEKSPDRRFSSTDELLEALSTIRAPGAPGGILVAEADADLRHLIDLNLVRAGLRVLHAADGEEAIELALRKSPDLICIDLDLPKMDGFAVVEYLKRTRTSRPVPIFLLSGHHDRQYEIYALRMGIDRYFTKPLALRELTREILARTTIPA